MRETQVQSLGGEDLLEKEMATHSSILAQKIPWTEQPVGLQTMGSKRVRQTRLSFHFLSFCVTPWTIAHQIPLTMRWILQARILEWVTISFSRGSS